VKGEIIPLVAAWLFLVFGLLAVQGVLRALWRTRRFRGRATGTLIALETPDGQSFRQAADIPVGPTAPLSFRPVAEFSLGGRKYTARGPFQMREVTKEISHAAGQGTLTTTVGPLALVPGQTLLVAYDPAEPADALVAATGYWLQLLSIQTFIGLMCIVIALLIFLFNGNLAWLGPDWHR
jgi:hypothetical protein